MYDTLIYGCGFSMQIVVLLLLPIVLLAVGIKRKNL